MLSFLYRPEGLCAQSALAELVAIQSANNQELLLCAQGSRSALQQSTLAKSCNQATYIISYFPVLKWGLIILVEPSGQLLAVTIDRCQSIVAFQNYCANRANEVIFKILHETLHSVFHALTPGISRAAILGPTFSSPVGGGVMRGPHSL